MNDEVILTKKPKDDGTVTFTIRVNRNLVEKFDELSQKSNYSRNELIAKAMEHFTKVVKVVTDDIDSDTVSVKRRGRPKKKKESQ